MIGSLNKDVLLQDTPDHITLDEFNRLKAALNNRYENLQRKSLRNRFIMERDEMLLNLLWVTGARVTDVLNIKSGDVDTHNQIIHIYVKKRKNKRYPISIDSDVSLMIVNYLNRWNLSGYLIPNVNDPSKPLDRKSVDHKLKILCDYTGLRKIHAHEFRHGLAMYLLSQGVPMEVISWRLKHSSTKTTMGIYARITPDIERNLIKDHISSYLG